MVVSQISIKTVSLNLLDRCTSSLDNNRCRSGSRLRRNYFSNVLRGNGGGSNSCRKWKDKAVELKVVVVRKKNNAQTRAALTRSGDLGAGFKSLEPRIAFAIESARIPDSSNKVDALSIVSVAIMGTFGALVNFSTRPKQDPKAWQALTTEVSSIGRILDTPGVGFSGFVASITSELLALVGIDLWWRNDLRNAIIC